MLDDGGMRAEHEEIPDGELSRRHNNLHFGPESASSRNGAEDAGIGNNDEGEIRRVRRGGVNMYKKCA